MLSRRLFASLAVTSLALMGAGPALAQGGDVLTVEHVQGTTQVPADPKRVLVFDIPALDTLDALGVDIAGVPSGAKPDHLSTYNSDDYVTIGTLFEPDYETVNAEAPDLIVVGGRSAPKYKDLSRIAPTIDLSLDPEHFVADAIDNTRTLGRIFDKEAEAERLVANLKDSIADLKATAAEAGEGLLILTTGGKMSAYGPGSRFGALHDTFGVTPAVPDLDIGIHGQAISFEFILEANPDWLFVIDRDAAIGRDGQPAQQFLDNEIVRKTDAWQNDRVVYLNAADWYLAGGGIGALQKTVDSLQTALSRN